MKLAERIRLIMIGLSAAAFLILAASPAAAFDPFQPPSCGNTGDAQVCVCQTGTSSTAVCSDSKNNSQDPVLKTVKTVADIIAVIAGLAAVITLMVAGLSYITSGGNAETTKKARSRVLGAIIGLVIIALAWVIVSFVVDRLLT